MISGLLRRVPHQAQRQGSYSYLVGFSHYLYNIGDPDDKHSVIRCYSELDISRIIIQWTVKGVIFFWTFTMILSKWRRKKLLFRRPRSSSPSWPSNFQIFFWWPRSLIPSSKGSFQEFSSHTILDKLWPCHPEVTSKYHGLRLRVNYEFCFVVLNPLRNWSPPILFCTGRGLVSWFTILLWVTRVIHLWWMPCWHSYLKMKPLVVCFLACFLRGCLWRWEITWWLPHQLMY